MNITLRFLSYGLLNLSNCVAIDITLDNTIVVKFLSGHKEEFYQSSADFNHFLFWIKHYDGLFNGQILDLEDFYQDTIYKIHPLEAVKYKTEVEFYEAI